MKRHGSALAGDTPLHTNQVDLAGSSPTREDVTGMHAGDRRISYLSQPMPVSMGDWWFDLATVDHFWFRRRFDVLRRLADPLLRKSRRLAEIGCGNGLLQRELEECYGISVAGFDLNEAALQKNMSRESPLFCYNIHDRNPEFRAHFDVLLMFDVLEHIENESEFLQSAKFHLADSGTLLINVPAYQGLYSDYDRAVGHVRRYSARQLEAVATQNDFKVRAWTYWGLSLVPLLLARKTLNLRDGDGKAGFDSRGKVINGLLSMLARCEPIPQKVLGTSVMAILQSRA